MDKKKKRNIIVVVIVMVVALLLYLTKDTVTRIYHSAFDSRSEISHVMLSELAKTEKMTVLSLILYLTYGPPKIPKTGCRAKRNGTREKQGRRIIF